MKNKSFVNYFMFMFMFILFSDSALTKESECIDAKNYKELILSGNYESLVLYMQYPIYAQIGGSEVKIYSSDSLMSVSKSIFTSQFLDFVAAKKSCDLEVLFDLKKNNGKIGTLVYMTDQEDTRYVKSGISSAKMLDEFLNKLKGLSSRKDGKALSKVFKYPFSLTVRGEIVQIKNEKEFFLYESEILDCRFYELIDEAYQSRKFVENVNGLMLNSKGDYWIVEVYGKLLLQASNPFDL